MLLIIAHHYVVNSGLMDASGPIYADLMSWRSVFLLLFGAWGKTGINCFVLITGYYMCKSQITAKKFVKLLFEIMFYRIVIFLAFRISGYEAFTVASLIKVIIPIKDISTGFTNAFLLFYLLIPFLSVLVQHLKQKQHFFLLIWCAFTYVVLGTVPGFSVTMNYVSWFSVLFVIASYIRLYPKPVYARTKVWILLTVVFALLCIISVVSCAWIGMRLNQNSAYRFVTDSNTILAVGTGVCAFLLFRSLEIGKKRLINLIASSTFGVFQIHTMGITMRQWLWVDTLDVVGHYASPLMPLHAIGSVLAIFVICTIIDQLRIRFIEKPLFKLWDKHWDSIQERYRCLETKITSKLGIQE